MKAKICPQCLNNIIMDKLTVKDIIIDVCPQCKGVYYDRGEMKKILAGSLDAETILSRLPYDNSNFICPACSINMDRICAQKGNLTYELYFCRSCLATFLKNEELIKIKKTLSATTFRPPSALRPKTIIETTFIHGPTRSPAGNRNEETIKKAEIKIQPENKNHIIANQKPAVETGQQYNRPQSTYTGYADTAKASLYTKSGGVSFTVEEERNALEHYKNINYEYAAEYETLSGPEYLFCFLSNLPVEVYNPRYYFPMVLILIIIANTVVYAVTFMLLSAVSTHPGDSSLNALRSFYTMLGVIPTEFISFKWLMNLISYQFLHAGFMHFAVNMYFLWVFGDNVCDIFYDRKETIDREVSFLSFYLLTGIISGIIHCFIYRGFDSPLVGASGAVAGIMGAYMRLFPYAKFYQIFLFYPFKIPAIYYIGLWIIGQIFIALSLGIQSSVSWPGHLGGFLAGYILISYFIPYSPEEITPES